MSVSSSTPKPSLQSFFSHPKIENERYLRSGYRADIYQISYQGQAAVAKVYKPHYASKYRSRYKADIARFEFKRNKLFYQIDALRPYCPQPFAYFPSPRCWPPIFIQEYVQGPTIREFTERHSHLPRTVVELGYAIVRIASQNRLYDLDMNDTNVFVMHDALGWKPMVCDFNMVPRHPLKFFLRLRKLNHRDYYNVRRWQRFPLR